MNNLGKTIYGFCNGYFGREDYETKIIIYETSNSICCRYLENNILTCANFENEEEKNKYIEKWCKDN